MAEETTSAGSAAVVFEADMRPLEAAATRFDALMARFAKAAAPTVTPNLKQIDRAALARSLAGVRAPIPAHLQGLDRATVQRLVTESTRGIRATVPVGLDMKAPKPMLPPNVTGKRPSPMPGFDASELRSARDRVGDELSRAATLTGAGIAGTLALATKHAVEFESAMRNVNSIAQLSERQFEALNASVVGIAQNPDVRQGPTDLAKGLYEVYSSGFKGKEALTVLQEAAEGATAGMTDTATSGKVLMATLNSGIPGVNGAGQAMDVLFKIVDRGVLNFADLSTSLGQVLPTASKAGVSLQETGAAIAVMTKSGQSASEATNDLLNLLNKLARPPKETEAAFQALGVSYGFAALQAKGLPGILQEIQAKTGGNADAIKKLLPDMQAQRAALSLLKDGGAVYRAELAEMSKASEGVGAKQRALTQQNKSTAASVAMARKEFEILSVQVRDATLPALNSLLRSTQSVLKWFNSLPKETQENVVKLGALASAALLLGGRLKDLTGFIRDVRTITLLSTIAAERHAIAAGTDAAAITAEGNAAAAASVKIGFLARARNLLLSRTGGALVGTALGIGGYEWMRDNGILDPDEHPDAATAARNVGRRIGGAASSINFTRNPGGGGNYVPLQPGASGGTPGPSPNLTEHGAPWRGGPMAGRSTPVSEAMRLLQGGPNSGQSPRQMAAEINDAARIINRDKARAAQAWQQYMGEWEANQKKAHDAMIAGSDALATLEKGAAGKAKGARAKAKDRAKQPPNLVKPMSVQRLRNDAARSQVKAAEDAFKDQARQITRGHEAVMKAAQEYKREVADARADAARQIQEARDRARLDRESEMLSRQPGATPEMVSSNRALTEHRLKLWRDESSPVVRLFNRGDKAGANKTARQLMAAEVERLGAGQSFDKLQDTLKTLPPMFESMLKDGAAWADSLASSITHLDSLYRERGLYHAPAGLSPGTREAIAGMQADADNSRLEANLMARGAGPLATARKMELARFAAGLGNLSTADAIAQLDAFEKKQAEALRTDALQQYAQAWRSMAEGMAADMATHPMGAGLDRESMIRAMLKGKAVQPGGIGDALGSVTGGGPGGSELFEGVSKTTEAIGQSRDKIGEYLQDVKDRVNLLRISDPINRELQNIHQNLSRQKWTQAEIDAVLPTAAAGLRMEQEMSRVQDAAQVTRDVIAQSLHEGFEHGTKAGVASLLGGLARAVQDRIIDDLSARLTNKLFRRQMESMGGSDVIGGSGGLVDFMGAILGKGRGDGGPKTGHDERGRLQTLPMPSMPLETFAKDRMFEAMRNQIGGFAGGTLGGYLDGLLPRSAMNPTGPGTLFNQQIAVQVQTANLTAAVAHLALANITAGQVAINAGNVTVAGSGTGGTQQTMGSGGGRSKNQAILDFVSVVAQAAAT